MADWQKIKTEYLTSDTSYRKLAQKYGVNATTIAKRASKEGWQSQRQQQASKTLSKTLNAVSSSQASRAARLQTVADKLLGKVESLLEQSDPLEMGTQSLKNISGVLKDLKEIQMIKSDADLREQEARIAKLRKEAEGEDDDNEIQVVITGKAKEYAK